MRFTQYLAVIVIAVVAAVAVQKFMPSNGVVQEHQETSFERVVRTNTIRCGYALWYPEMVKSPTDGKLSGYDYDVTMQLADVLGLKVDWVEEASWGNAEQGLITKRYDMLCNGLWGPAARAKVALFSIPFVHHQVFVVTNPKIDGPVDSSDWLNDPKYSVSVIPGSPLAFIAKTHFPKAKIIDAFELSTDGDTMQNVATGKADFNFSNLTTINRFLEQNPGSIKMLNKSVETASGAFLLPNDDVRMKLMVDRGLRQILDAGIVRDIMTRYMGNDPRQWQHPAPPYENP